MPPIQNKKHHLSLPFQVTSGWLLTTILCAIPVLLWLQLNPPRDSLTSVYRAAGYLGKIAGLVGLVLYALNLVYATRLKFLERLFGGLNRVYIAHHIVGGLALIFLSLHPVFLVIQELRSSVRSAALLLVPNGLMPLSALFDSSANEHFTVLRQWAIFFGLIAFVGMVILLVLTFFVRLPYKIWLFTHKFLGIFFFFGGLHVFFIDSDVSAGAIRWYILTIVAIGLLAYIYRTVLGKILVRRYPYTVESVTPEGDAVHIAMRPVKTPISYKAGQFIFIRFPQLTSAGVANEWHPFSISSAPQSTSISLTAKSLGDFTHSLVRVPSGANVEIEGAFGKFTYTNFSNKNQIWIAGGIGITPFLSMAQNIHEHQDYNVDLYYSVKSESELIGIQKLTEVVNLPGNTMRVIPYDTSKFGFLTADAVRKVSGELIGKEFFICGPPAMMKSMRTQLRAAGVQNSAIHSEEFSLS